MSNELSKEHQQALLQTVLAALERNEKGKVYPEVPNRTNSGLVKYFTPSYIPELDKYGNIKEGNNDKN